ncbi:MAG: SGNH/GDSL hydrolase family protein [Fibrobacteria bacterium]|nr:SGNH/GDSL hydrolase family protein [Fibrobacteria bacterium]
MQKNSASIRLFFLTILVSFVFSKIVFCAHFNMSQSMAPFWSTDTMYNESVLMMSSDGGAPQAKLLFTPLDILSVKSSSLDVEYAEGVDWVWEDGVLKLLSGSSAVSLTEAELYPSTPGGNTFPRAGGGYILYSEGNFFHGKQLAVTYTHEGGLWMGPVPVYQEKALANVIAKLKSGKKIKIVFFGDSITEGYNASGMLVGASPYTPSWAELVCANLNRYYTSSVTFLNTAKAGERSNWGLANVAALVTAHKPDLVVIAFGMNDGNQHIQMLPETFKSNVQGMINNVRSQNPSAEFILVSTTLANSETAVAVKQAEYITVLNELASQGIVVADMTGAHAELLKHKDFKDMTGNNVNHPNDFLVRWYAQQVSGLLIPEGTPDISLKQNMASSAQGGITSASSFELDIAHHSMANNGDRRGFGYGTNRNGSGWEDGTSGSFPDWLQIEFDGEKVIDEIDVFTVQDAVTNPVEPTEDLTFTLLGITDFSLQYFKDSAWVDLPGGNITGNNKVWFNLAFEPVVTTKIKLVVNNGLASRSRVTELEAWGYDVVRGCTDSAYLEYDSTANVNNPEMCKEKIKIGCMDTLFVEYDSTANVNDSGLCQVVGINEPLLQSNRVIQFHSNVLLINSLENHVVKVYDMNGVKRWQGAAEGRSEYNLNKVLTNGLYTVVVKTDDEVFKQIIFNSKK